MTPMSRAADEPGRGLDEHAEAAGLAGGARPSAPATGVETLVVLACGALAALLALSGAPAPLRLYPGLAAVLVLPGWSLRMALCPQRGDLGGVERLSLALGLSVAVVTSLALALSAMPGGLSQRGMVAGITAWTLAALAAAWARRRGAAADDLRQLGWPEASASEARASALGGWVLAASLLTASIALWVVVGAPDAESAEFSMAGAQGLMEQYPLVTGPGQVVVPVTIASRRRTSATYQVVVRLDGATLASAGPVALAPGATWRGLVRFAVPPASGDQVVGLLLYERGRPDPCCHLWLRMHAGASLGASRNVPP